MIGIGVVEAPWGPIHVAADANGVVALEVLTTFDAFVGSVRRRLAGAVVAGDPDDPLGPATERRLAAAIDAIEAFLGGRPDLLAQMSYRLHGLTAWDRSVLDGVRLVPWGQVTSYGRLATRIGRPGAARAVGGAVGRNPIGLIVPCHRVIAGDGSIGGYGGSWSGDREALLDVKRELLAIEGSTTGAAGIPWTAADPAEDPERYHHVARPLSSVGAR